MKRRGIRGKRKVVKRRNRGRNEESGEVRVMSDERGRMGLREKMAP